MNTNLLGQNASPAANAVTSSQAYHWAQDHWILIIICAIVLLLLIVFVIVPLFAKLFAKRKKNQEVSGLKKELSIWKNLSALVRGGKDADNAKQNLSAQIQLLTTSFKQGLKLFADRRMSKNDVPWFMVLGEPQAGKSSLLANSDLEFVNTSTYNTSETGQLPLSCWLSPKAFLINVSGHVLFDRWVEGSSAEWNHLLKLVCAHHSRRPLDGIILTIPADALLADDESLTKQKATLVGAELYHLLSKTGMNIPCHVVVTKLDMLQGFREFFSQLPEEQRNNLFGWENPLESGVLSVEKFNQYMESTVDVMRNSCGVMLQNHGMFRTDDERPSYRQETATKIFLFPESFNNLRKNLGIYMSLLFSRDGWLGNGRTPLNGVFFTSALDNGITFSKTYASLWEKKLEEAPMDAHRKEEKRPFFIRQLLQKRIFACPRKSTFTAMAQMRRHIPAYIVCMLCLMLSCFWVCTALFDSDAFSSNCNQMAQYYRKVAKSFQDGSIAKSPIVEFNENKQPQLKLFTAMANSLIKTRLDFLHDLSFLNNSEEMQNSFKNVQAPWGFKLSALIMFGPRTQLGYVKRHTIAYAIQNAMVQLPLFAVMQEKFLNIDENEPMTLVRSKAGMEFCALDQPKNMEAQFIQKALLYLFPDINENSLKLLSQIEPTPAEVDMFWNEKLYNYNFSQARNNFIALLMDKWQKLDIYNETEYHVSQKMRNNILNFDKSQKETIEMTRKLPAEMENAGKVVERFWELQQQQRQCCDDLDEEYQQLVVNECFLNKEAQKSDNQALATWGNFSSQAFENYKKLFYDDVESLTPFMIENSGKSEKDAKKTLRPEFNAFKERVQEIFEQEKARVNQQYKDILASEILSIASPAKKDSKDATSDEDAAEVEDCFALLVFDELNDLMLESPKLPKLTSVKDFQAMLEEQNRATQGILERYDAMMKFYPENKIIAKRGQLQRNLLVYYYHYIEDTLMRQFVDLFPRDIEHLYTLIESIPLQGDSPIQELNQELTAEAIGKVEIPTKFAPYSGRAVLDSWWLLKNYLEGLEKNKQATTIKQEEVVYLDFVCNQYIGEYLLFWQNFPNSIVRACSSWKEFRLLCSTLKSYEVNHMLHSVYQLSTAALSLIPEKMLTKAQKDAVAKTLGIFKAKSDILNSHYSDICIRQLSSWATLPEDPAVAYNYLTGQSNKNLLDNFVALASTGQKADIPWWNSFLLNGIECLKKDATAKAVVLIDSYGDILFKFPLCADAEPSEAATGIELQQALDELKRMGFAVSEAQEAIVGVPQAKQTMTLNAGLVALRTNDTFSRVPEESRKWGERKMQIAEVLLNAENRMVWTLSLPDITKQKELTTMFYPGVQMAIYRYRYMQLTAEGNSLLDQTLLASSAHKELARGDVAAKDLAFHFSAHTQNNDGTVEVSIPGNWSILRLYLTKQTYISPEDKTIYVPMQITDKRNIKSVLWFSLKFSKPLPLPSDWPTKANRLAVSPAAGKQ